VNSLHSFADLLDRWKRLSCYYNRVFSTYFVMQWSMWFIL